MHDAAFDAEFPVEPIHVRPSQRQRFGDVKAEAHTNQRNSVEWFFAMVVAPRPRGLMAPSQSCGRRYGQLRVSYSAQYSSRKCASMGMREDMSYAQRNSSGNDPDI
jgi:hypothetical protein